VRSIRLDSDLDERIRRAAGLAGETVSEFLRRAAAERADRTLATPAGHPFADVAGAVHGHGGQARRTGAAFTEQLRAPRPQRGQRRRRT